jgi:hypothetical protein
LERGGRGDQIGIRGPSSGSFPYIHGVEAAGGCLVAAPWPGVAVALSPVLASHRRLVWPIGLIVWSGARAVGVRVRAGLRSLWRSGFQTSKEEETKWR